MEVVVVGVVVVVIQLRCAWMDGGLGFMTLDFAPSPPACQSWPQRSLPPATYKRTVGYRLKLYVGTEIKRQACHVKRGDRGARVILLSTTQIMDG